MNLQKTVFMRIRKYIPDKDYGFLFDEDGQQAFFHASVFESGSDDDAPAPVPDEEVLVTLDVSESEKKEVPRALRVRRIQKPFYMEGQILSFDESKGYGFIQTEDKITYYLHRSEVVDGTLPMVGRKVFFYVSKKERGARASYVKILIGAKQSDV